MCNPTNHSFFNLNGAGKADIENHVLRIDADSYLEIDDKMLTKGEPASVESTPFDFRPSKSIGQDIRADNAQLHFAGGYDHNYILNGEGDIHKDVVEVSSPLARKKGSFELETQFFPDSIHHTDYPSVILTKGEEKKYQTRYTFQK